MTGWYFVIAFVVAFSQFMHLKGRHELVAFIVIALSGVVLSLLHRLERLQAARALMFLIAKPKFFFGALETAIERVEMRRFSYELLSDRDRQDYWDNVHLLPILAVLVRQGRGFDPRVTELAHRAEALYEESRKRR